jgi:hypothetical protein
MCRWRSISIPWIYRKGAVFIAFPIYLLPVAMRAGQDHGCGSAILHSQLRQDALDMLIDGPCGNAEDDPDLGIGLPFRQPARDFLLARGEAKGSGGSIQSGFVEEKMVAGKKLSQDFGCGAAKLRQVMTHV